MINLLQETEHEREHYVLIRITVLEQIKDFFEVFLSGTAPIADLNLETTCS